MPQFWLGQQMAVVFCYGYNKSQIKIKSKLWDELERHLEKVVQCALLRKSRFIHYVCIYKTNFEIPS